MFSVVCVWVGVYVGVEMLKEREIRLRRVMWGERYLELRGGVYGRRV